MGIVNLTPDSFSGDGVGNNSEAALAHARRQVEAGADLLDLGAESSRPGAAAVSEEDELSRLLPVIKGVLSLGVPVSVDTCKPGVMQAALQAGASMVNDIRALAEVGALDVVANSNCGVCLMHMQGEPRTMQQSPGYSDVVDEVESFLLQRAQAAEEAGVAKERIVLDPGFGFGKTLEHNRALFAALPRLAAHGYPLLAGLSRKSMLGQVTGRPVQERMVASVAAAVMAAEYGAAILRVHDVAETIDAIKTWSAVRKN